MAQYLDLTGLTYFKSKLLSSALHFYTGGGTTSNVTFDFGKMKSGSSIEREIYLNVQDADGIYSNTMTISDGGLVLSSGGASTTSPSTVNVKVNQIQLSKPDTNMTGDVYNINMIDTGMFISGSQSSLADSKIALIVNSDLNNTHYILSDSECADYNGSDIVLKDTQLILRAYNWASPSKIILNDTELRLDAMYLYGGSGKVGGGQCILGYDSISIGTSNGVGSYNPELERCSNLALGETGYTYINIGGETANINLGTNSYNTFTVTSGNFQVASNGDISKIRQLKGGSNNYIWFSGNDIVFHNGQGNEINLATIIANIYTCLRGDTSYITMADRSRKLIQDIEPGDVVLSYDVNKKDYCEAVVLANDMTGMESRFDTFVFENGTTVDVYGDEPFIFEASDVLTLGTIQKLYDYHTKGDDRRWVLTHTPGAKARVIRKFSNVICEEPVGRYMLVTSNGAFFVNGMLKGNMSNFIDSYYKKRHNKLPDNIQTFLTEIGHKLAAFDNGLENDHVDATVLKQLEIKWSAVHSAKDFLTATDYKAMKYAEGAMTEEEWLPVKAQRAEMRAVINENEAEIAELREQLPENLKQPTWVGKAQIWAECEGILNDHLQDFKDFINERYSKTEE